MTYARTSRVALAAIVLAGMAASVPSTVAAQEKDEAFKAGVEAMKDKKWDDVVKAMRQAIKEDENEAPRKVGRVFNKTDYLPHFFLGDAFFKLNNCVEAVKAWETSIRQRVVQTRPEYYSQVQKGNAACEAKGVLLADKFGAAVTHAHAQVDAANAAMTRLKGKGDDNANVWRAQPRFAAEYLGASNEYDAARKHLEEAKRSRLGSDFEEVAKAAARARELSETLERDLNAAIEKARGILGDADAVRQNIKDAQALDDEIETHAKYLDPTLIALRQDGRKALEDARGQLDPRRLSDSTIAAARSSVGNSVGLLTKVRESVQAAAKKDLQVNLARATALATAAFSRADAEWLALQSLMQGNPAKVTPELQAGAEAARKQLETARRKRDSAIGGQQLAGVENAIKQADLAQQTFIDIEVKIGGLVDPNSRVPVWLREGATRYLDGDYAGALDRLDDGTVEGPAQLHAYLFRAAAQHALYVRSGDTTRRAQAIAEIKRCKELDSTFVPDGRAFSPAFLDFYQRDGAAPRSAARAQ